MHPQGVGDTPEGVHAGVFGARLDHGKVAAGHPGQAGQHLLRQVLPDAQITDDPPGDFAVVWDHGFSPFADSRRFASIRGHVIFANFAKGKNLSANADRKKLKACYSPFGPLFTMRMERNGGWGMKKGFCVMVLLAILLSAVPAFADDLDVTALTDEQLQQVIDQGEEKILELENIVDAAKTEQAKRKGEAPADSGGVQHTPVAVKRSPDKYTWYIQDYVGRNAASVGYTSLGGDRLERYGTGVLEFTFVTEDGTYLDFEDESVLRQYIVVDQNLAPNTEMKLVFQKNSQGKEYDNLVDYQSIETIDLLARRLDGKQNGEAVKAEMIPIKASPDKYTWYMRNYVGRNVAAFGYTSLGGYRMDKYGEGYIKLNFIADDGAYIDPSDFEQLKQYVVTRQDVAPNTVIRLTFMKDSKGNEYSNLVQSQSYESITLYVHRLNNRK